MRDCELRSGTYYPRPVVLEGDLGHSHLGLDSNCIDWLAQNCTSVIHNAASLVFRGDSPDGEPFLSNVEGTRNTLDLCRTTNIRHFHHVSTAYVCGLRNGCIQESDVDVGQSPSNAYEATKLLAEQMVRAADFLDRPTIYRPSIIVGDSTSGFTSTFHGFYAPLKLAHTLVSKVVRGATAGSLLIAALGLRGDERKNFVPVDWVSATICHLHGNSDCRGSTYHLTSPHPTSIAEMAAVMQQVVEAMSPLGESDTSWNYDGAWFEKTFREQMAVYGAYWRDDPQFDVTNTRRAAPHLPCPCVDSAMLTRLARYAIESNFGRGRSRENQPRKKLGSLTCHVT